MPRIPTAPAADAAANPEVIPRVAVRQELEPRQHRLQLWART
ncbi:hypothetical protein [Helicobacter aurati]|nr:hypothetical protein [Helicobacter aurati]